MVGLVGIAYPAQSPYPRPVCNSWGVTLPQLCSSLRSNTTFCSLAGTQLLVGRSLYFPYLHSGLVWMFLFPFWGRTDVFSYNLKDQPAQILLSQKLPGTHQEASPAGSQAYFSALGQLSRLFSFLCCAVLSCFSCVWLFDPRTVSHQSPLSLGFSRQEYWSGLPCPPPGDHPNPRVWTCISYVSCTQDSLPLAPLGKPFLSYSRRQSWATLLTASLTGGAVFCLWQMEPGASFLIVLKGDRQPFSLKGFDAIHYATMANHPI